MNRRGFFKLLLMMPAIIVAPEVHFPTYAVGPLRLVDNPQVDLAKIRDLIAMKSRRAMVVPTDVTLELKQLREDTW